MSLDEPGRLVREGIVNVREVFGVRGFRVLVVIVVRALLVSFLMENGDIFFRSLCNNKKNCILKNLRF